MLELAEDETLPLLERAKFLAIFASNLDEFYMVRVAGLKRRAETGLAVRSPDGLTIREQLELDHRSAPRSSSSGTPTSSSRTSRRGSRTPGIRIVHWEDLTDDDAGGCASTSATRSSRCSRRSPSTRRTRSPTSAGSR